MSCDKRTITVMRLPVLGDPISTTQAIRQYFIGVFKILKT